MTQINQLAAYSNPSGGDQLAVFSTSNGDARKLSLTNLRNWLATAFETLTVTSYVKVPTVETANLPSAVTAGAGARAMVSDSDSATFNATFSGGGANVVPVFSDGTNWRIG